MARYWLVAVVILTVGLCGCGAKEMPALPKTFAVKGKVLVGSGQPLDGGRLTFHSTDPAQKTYEGIAELEKDGTFQVTTWAANDGLMPGTYTVTISPLSLKTADQRRVNESKIPQKYRDDSTTPWKVTIETKETTLEPHTIGR